MNLPESKMSPVVSEWLKRQGFTVYAEVRYGDNIIDLVGERRGETVAVELKMSFGEPVINQAWCAQAACDRAYCAVPKMGGRRERYDLCQDRGVGILIVTDEVQEYLPAKKIPAAPLRNPNFIKRLKAGKSGGIGGLPCLKDEMLEALAEAVRAFIGERRMPDWRTIFENVPSEFSSPLEMKKAIAPRLKKMNALASA